METTIAVKLRLAKELGEKDITQILVAYSKTHNLSTQMAYVMEQISLENFDKLRAREISIIIYTLVVQNQFYSENLLEKSLAHFKKWPE